MPYFYISVFFTGCTPKRAVPTEAVYHPVDCVIVDLRHDRGGGGEVDLRITTLHAID
jgi:hypothetical protein